MDGELVSTVMPVGGWAAGLCAWSGPAASFFLGVGTASSLRASGDASANDAATKVDAFVEQAEGPVTEVDDVGDRAVLSSGGLATHRNGVYVEITRLRLADSELIQIARVAIANL